MNHEENQSRLGFSIRDPQKNLSRFIVGLEPGDPSTGDPPALVTLERVIIEPPEEDMDKCPRWRTRVDVVATRSLTLAEGLPAMVNEVQRILECDPIAKDFDLVVNVTHGDAMRRLLGQKNLWGMSLTIGASDDARNQIVTSESLWGAVRLALQQERLKAARDLPQAHAVTSVFEGRTLRPGLATALALAVWRWSRRNTSDVPIVTRRPTPEQVEEAQRAQNQNDMSRRGRELRRQERDDFDATFGEGAYLGDLAHKRLGK